MNKNLKIITINGVRGLFMAIFIVFGLVSGFILSPAWVCMKLWNIFVSENFSLPQMNFYQGLLLWAIIALTLHLLNNKRSLIGFGSYSKLSNEQIKDIIEKSKKANSNIMNDLETVIKSETASELVSNKEKTTVCSNDNEQKEIRG